jgi:hypothetical protein
MAASCSARSRSLSLSASGLPIQTIVPASSASGEATVEPKILARVVADAVRHKEGDVPVEQDAFGETAILLAQRSEQERCDIPCRCADGYGLPVGLPVQYDNGAAAAGRRR